MAGLFEERVAKPFMVQFVRWPLLVVAIWLNPSSVSSSQIVMMQRYRSGCCALVTDIKGMKQRAVAVPCRAVERTNCNEEM